MYFIFQTPDHKIYWGQQMDNCSYFLVDNIGMHAVRLFKYSVPVFKGHLYQIP